MVFEEMAVKYSLYYTGGTKRNRVVILMTHYLNIFDSLEKTKIISKKRGSCIIQVLQAKIGSAVWFLPDV